MLSRIAESLYWIGRYVERAEDTSRILDVFSAGPGRLTQALGITGDHDGLPLDRKPFELHARDGAPEIVTGLRIGITKAVDRPWRYGLKGSRFLSRSFASPVPRRG